LLAFGQVGVRQENQPGAVFFVLEAEPRKIVLGKTVELTDVIAVIPGRENEAEWVRSVTVEGTVNIVHRIRRIGR
jgi:hypothetical protein